MQSTEVVTITSVTKCHAQADRDRAAAAWLISANIAPSFPPRSLSTTATSHRNNSLFHSMSNTDKAAQPQDFDFWEYVACSRCCLSFTPDSGGPPPVPFWVTECGHVVCNNHLSNCLVRPRVLGQAQIPLNFLRVRSELRNMRRTRRPSSTASTRGMSSPYLSGTPANTTAADGTSDGKLVLFRPTRFRRPGLCD